MTRDMRTHPVTHAEFILELTGEFAIPRLDGLPIGGLETVNTLNKWVNLAFHLTCEMRCAPCDLDQEIR
jgi:hypothetical protein